MRATSQDERFERIDNLLDQVAETFLKIKDAILQSPTDEVAFRFELANCRSLLGEVGRLLDESAVFTDASAIAPLRDVVAKWQSALDEFENKVNPLNKEGDDAQQ
jgi:hypothetical protein